MSTAEIAALLTSLAAHAAAGLVVHSPVSVEPSVAAAVEASGVPLLALTRGASWTQLAALLRSLRDLAAARRTTCGRCPGKQPLTVTVHCAGRAVNQAWSPVSQPPKPGSSP